MSINNSSAVYNNYILQQPQSTESQAQKINASEQKTNKLQVETADSQVSKSQIDMPEPESNQVYTKQSVNAYTGTVGQNIDMFA